MGALVLGFGIGEEHLLSQVDGQLPAVSGVSLLDVDDEEIDLIAVPAVELIESGNLPPEGRSSITAEDQHYRLTRQTPGKPDASPAIIRFKVKVRSMSADPQRTGPGDAP